MSATNFHQQIHDNINKQHQNFRKIDQFLEEVNGRLIKVSKFKEQNLLANYKEEMQKTKSEFGNITKTRNDQVIQTRINAQKKQLEKECTASIKKSLQISKMYESLKHKWSSFNSLDHQMNEQKQYLLRQIKRATGIKKCLQTDFSQLSILAEQRIMQKKSKNLLCPLPTKTDVKTYKQLVSYKNIFHIQKIPPLSQKAQQRKIKVQQIRNQTQARLKHRIQNKTQYLNSMIMTKNFIETKFCQYSTSDQKSNADKLRLIQKILSQQSIKKQLYSMLFHDNKFREHSPLQDKTSAKLIR